MAYYDLDFTAVPKSSNANFSVKNFANSARLFDSKAIPLICVFAKAQGDNLQC